jgi:hypothetical protein
MKTPCASVSTLLEKYFDREATDQEMDLVKAHLQECSACQKALAGMAEIHRFSQIPPEAVPEEKDFDRVWLKIEREIRRREESSWQAAFRHWLNLSTLFQRRVWVPAVAAMALALFFIAGPSFFEKSPSLPANFSVEYVESETNNVMVYELEKSKVTVIWLFEGPEAEWTAS